MTTLQATPLVIEEVEQVPQQLWSYGASEGVYSSYSTLAGTASPLMGHVQPLPELFKQLADQWHDATDGMSSPRQIAMHPAYQRIIGLSKSAIPYILDDLITRGGNWYWALRSLADEPPIVAEMAGNTRRVKQAWIDWGRRNGYIA